MTRNSNFQSQQIVLYKYSLLWHISHKYNIEVKHKMILQDSLFSSKLGFCLAKCRGCSPSLIGIFLVGVTAGETDVPRKLSPAIERETMVYHTPKTNS